MTMVVPTDTPSSGQRRAARRVKQRKRQDSRRWSPSGALRPSSSSNRLDLQQRKDNEQRKPWNDRFIYDDEELLERPAIPSSRRSGVRRTWNSDGKENDAKEDPGGVSTRHYTERADGEAVTEFTRYEVTPSTPVKLAEGNDHHNLIGRRSVGVSPFDLEKVRAALEADTNESSSDETDGHSYEEQRPLPPLHELAENKTRAKIQLSSLQVGAVLDQLEELLLTTEAEEGLLRRDMTTKPTTTRSLEVDDHSDNESTSPDQGVVSVPRERQDKILEYVQACRLSCYQLEKDLVKSGPLQYPEIIELLAEEVLESCINDIAEELEGAINLCSEQIFRQL